MDNTKKFEIRAFNNNEFKVRVTDINNEPWFVGKDVAECLGYKKPRNAIATHVDNEDKTTALVQGVGSKYKSRAVLINESGMYSLILSSKLPSAKKFKHWVTSEVIPSIRKTGSYQLPDVSYSESLRMLADKIDENERLNRQIETMEPKVKFADMIGDATGCIMIRDLAKIMKGNGIDIGGNRLFKWMRDNGYIIKSNGLDHNRPTQKGMNLGLFRIKEKTYKYSDKQTNIATTTLVTTKGQKYFINLFLKMENTNV